MIGNFLFVFITINSICVAAAVSSTKYSTGNVFLSSSSSSSSSISLLLSSSSRSTIHMNIMFGIPRGGGGQNLDTFGKDVNLDVDVGREDGDEDVDKEKDNDNNVAASEKMYNKQATNWVRTKPR